MADTESSSAAPPAVGRARFHPSRRMTHVSGIALLVIALGMIGWVMILSETLRDSVRVHDWAGTWIGLDIAELITLGVIGVLLIRRNPHVDIAAAVGATLFAVDAWFDVLTSEGSKSHGQAVLLACIAEIPMTLLLAFVAWRSRHWFTHPHRKPPAEDLAPS